MSSRPIVSAEELACLLQGDSAVTCVRPLAADRREVLLAQGGALLWLLKGLLLYVALQSLRLSSLPEAYVWARCALEVAGCAVFWSTLRQREHRAITLGAGLVALTTLCMDLLMWLALPA